MVVVTFCCLFSNVFQRCRKIEYKPAVCLLDIEIKDEDIAMIENDGEPNAQDVETKENDGETKIEDVVAKEKRLRVRIKILVLYLQAMKARLPLSISLAMVFLACHIAQEPILPTDIVQWALDGGLPFLTAFQVLEPKDGVSWPLPPRHMFKPAGVLGAKRLEFMAALIAKRIGLDLPPVNFHAISRLLTCLNLPVDKLTIFISRIYDWYTPPELWLSAESTAIPTRIYVMAMIVIVLRVLYKFDGRWHCGTSPVKPDIDLDPLNDKEKWNSGLQVEGYVKENEAGMSGPHFGSNDILLSKETVENPSRAETEKASPSSSDADGDTWNLKHLIEMLENSWQDRGKDCFGEPLVEIVCLRFLTHSTIFLSNHILDVCCAEVQKDLDPYLKYCQDLVFPGLDLKSEEAYVCEELWKLYEKLPNKVSSYYILRVLESLWNYYQRLKAHKHIL